MVHILLIALLAAPQDPAEAAKTISTSVDKHCARWDPIRRAEATADLVVLWKTLPEGDLRERALMRIVRTLESATHLFPRDREYRDLRERHPALPVFEVPDRFHVRAYENAVRLLKALLENAIAFRTRTPEARKGIADQINALMDRAVEAFSAKAANEDALAAIEEHVKKRRDECLHAMEDPFAGYLKALEPKALAELRDKIVKQAEAAPRLERGAMNPPKEPHRAPETTIGHALGVVHDIPKAYSPARFAAYDVSRALTDEVYADWREQVKKCQQVYLEKAREEEKK